MAQQATALVHELHPTPNPWQMGVCRAAVKSHPIHIRSINAVRQGLRKRRNKKPPPYRRHRATGNPSNSQAARRPVVPPPPDGTGPSPVPKGDLQGIFSTDLRELKKIARALL